MSSPSDRALPTDLLARQYSLSDWKGWAHAIDASVDDFYDAFGVLPNALVACDATFRRIDMVADRQRVQNADGAHPEDAEYAPLAGFCGPDYQLDFLLNDTVEDRSFTLVYEAGGGDEGEPIVDDEDMPAQVSAAA